MIARTVVGILLTIGILTSLWDCDGGGQSEPPPRRGGVSNVHLDSIVYADCGNDAGPCYAIYHIGFTDTVNMYEAWYRPRVNPTGKGECAIGDSVFLQPTGPNDTMEVQIVLYHFDSFREDYFYQLSVERLKGDFIEFNGAVMQDSSVHGPAFDADCASCCCSDDSTYGRRRYYAQLYRDSSEIESVRARMRVRYPWLCREFCSSSFQDEQYSHSCAHIGLAAYPSDAKVWAQMGFVRQFNNPPHLAGWSYIEGPYVEAFNELNPDYFYQYVYEWYHEHHVTDGDWLEAKIWINCATGRVHWYKDGSELGSWYLGGGFEGYSATRVHWTGEVAGQECDMPGTASLPVKFENCEFKRSGEIYWEDAGFNQSGMNKDLEFEDEWRIYRVDDRSFLLYDKALLQ